MIRKLFLSLSLLGATAVIPAAASAQWHGGRHDDARPTVIVEQQTRGHQGRFESPRFRGRSERVRFQSPRTLSYRERAMLERSSQRIAHMESMARADGYLTPREVRRIAMARAAHARLLARLTLNGRVAYNGGNGWYR